jgi:hypothetical protein
MKIMKFQKTNRVSHLALVTALFPLLAAVSMAGQNSTPAPGSASTDQSSLGDYARKIHKDPAPKSKPKVFDNDNIPKDDKLSIVGEAAPDTAPDSAIADPNAKTLAPADAKDRDKDKDKDKDSGAGKASSAPAPAPEDDQARKQKDWKQWQDRLAAQKDAVDLASRELDVLQKEYQLRAAAIYADVGNRLRNQTQWDKEDADYKQKIADKTKAVEDAKQKLEDLQEDARKAGVPASMREP